MRTKRHTRLKLKNSYRRFGANTLGHRSPRTRRTRVRPPRYLPRRQPRPDAAKTGRHTRLNCDYPECRSRNGADLKSEKQESDQPRGSDHLGSETVFKKNKKVAHTAPMRRDQAGTNDSNTGTAMQRVPGGARGKTS